MKTLPYFRWYPADAETDASYSAMNWAERGFYHWCLNYSWINDGLPGDLAEIGRAAKMTRRELDKLWIRVGKCFTVGSGAWRNRRQEEERAHAKSKSERATESVRSRYVRTANDLPRAGARADSPSVSASVSASEVKELHNFREMPKSDFHARFESLYALHPIAGFKADGQLRYLEILSSAVNVELAADAIDRNHAEYEKFWEEHPSEFRPGIGKYFEDGWYLRKPAAKARDSPTSRLTASQIALKRAREEMQNAESR